MAGGSSVLIEHVSANDGAQPLGVEKRVLDFERIESPLNQIDAARERLVALGQFQPLSNFSVPVLRENSQHVAVQITLAAGFQTRYRQTKSDHALAVKSSEHQIGRASCRERV